MRYKLIPLTLEQHQQILYEILYFVDDFCKANDIPYFLVGGTLLGAVRHQGIIPWDDDVDIAMTRENYVRFIEVFRRSSKEGYELYDFEQTPNYYVPFLKLARTDTWTNVRQTHRIGIDIFSYDGCGDDLQQAQLYFLQTQRKIRVVSRKFKMAYVSGIHRIKYFIQHFSTVMLYYLPLKYNTPKRLKYLHSVYDQCSRFKVTDSKYSANVAWGLYGKGEVQPSEYFIKLTTMQFGKRSLPVPSGWHEYLKGLYGNYMKLPPIDRRQRHSKISYKIEN